MCSLGVLVFIQILLRIFVFKKFKRKWKRHLITIFSLLMMVLTGYSTFVLKQGIDSLKTISEEVPEEVLTFSLVVQKESEINDLDAVSTSKVLKPTTQDQTNINSYLKEFKDIKDVNISTVDCTDYLDGAKQVLADKNKVLRCV